MSQQYAMRTNLSVRLPDGRRLGYGEYGAPDGTPMLFFHGSLGSRHIHTDMADIAARRNIRLIAVDRPGYGLSDVKHGRTLLDWADDVAALTDTLGIEQFSLIGFSGGTPYTLACAYRFPQRIHKIALAGAFAPLEVPGVMDGLAPSASGLYALAQSNPAELRSILAAIAPSPEALVSTMLASVIEWDRNVIQARQEEFVIECTEMLRTGIEGVFSDYQLFSKTWGFPLDGISTEMHLWCGTEDCHTSPAMTAYLASVLTNSQTSMLHDEGHYALYAHWEEVLAG